MLELLRGRAEEAQRHITAVGEGPVPRLGLAFRLGYNATAATIELWSGQPAAALDRALPVLESGEETEEPVMLAPLLVLAARAAADLRDRARGEQLRDLHRRLTGDPFAPHPLLVTPAAQGATWAAELARLEGHETVDGLGRSRRGLGPPHAPLRRGVLPLARGAGGAGDRPGHAWPAGC